MITVARMSSYGSQTSNALQTVPKCKHHAVNELMSRCYSRFFPLLLDVWNRVCRSSFSYDIINIYIYIYILPIDLVSYRIANRYRIRRIEIVCIRGWSAETYHLLNLIYLTSWYAINSPPHYKHFNLDYLLLFIHSLMQTVWFVFSTINSIRNGMTWNIIELWNENSGSL